jgi:crotonobetainyl-CoA:carnitine CoA-transferase CaiB-like acyl-CoA transferase
MNESNVKTTQPSNALPLAGIRVLDLSQVMAGPFCTMLLGDMGADVIKIEPPGSGDQTRRAMGFYMKGTDSAGYLQLNRNKRSVTLDLKTSGGKQVLYELVKTADVLVENGRPGVAARLGYGYDVLKEINPRLVYASISGFGQSGPWAGRPGFDMIAQAMSGVMGVTGHPGQAPVRNTISAADLGAGLFALYGIQSALIGRQRTGKGQLVDANLFDSVLSLAIWEAAEYWGTGKVPQASGSANRMSAPYQAVRAQDGYFVLGAANQKLWSALCDVLQRPELMQDDRFLNNTVRLQNREALIEEIERTLAERPVAEWVDLLLAAGIPAGPMNTFAQSLDSEHVRAREMVMSISHPVEGEIKTLGFPVRLSETPQQVRHAPPLLGQHTDEVLAELGLSAGLLQELHEQRAFVPATR